MRNKVLLVLLLILCGVSVSAQEFDEFIDLDYEDYPRLRELKGKKLLEKIVPQKDARTGLWGYVNEEGKYNIRPLFTDACPYEGHVARISVSDKWGAINEKGIYQILPIYESMDSFSPDSLARVVKDGKYGLVDNYGELIVPVVYDYIDYAAYGYLVCKNSLYGTIDQTGKIILEPQFDAVSELNYSDGLEHICKDGKWGILRDGETVLDLEWDQPCSFLQNGKDGLPNLYLVVQNGRQGVVAENGKYVVPIIYDDISLSMSGEYYITCKDGKYGAISLKMDEIVAPVLDSRPSLGENIFKVHDNGQFYCVNKQGCVTFDICDQMYYVYKPEEYVTTKYYPDWAKSYIAAQNAEARLSRLEKASGVVSNRVGIVFQTDDREKYGLMSRGSFLKSSGTIRINDGSQPLNVLYEAKDGYGFSIAMSGGWTTGDYLLVSDGLYVSLANVFDSFGIEGVTSVCPIDFTINENDRVTVHLGILRSSNPNGALKTYSSSVQGESHLILILSSEDFTPLYCSEMDTAVGGRLVASRFGGYYSLYSSSVVMDNSHPLKRFDRNGKFDWEFYANPGETFFDIEETENCVYLCGVEKFAGKETPILLQISNRGEKMATKVLDFLPVKPNYILSRDYVLYAGKGNDFWPVAAPYEMGDEIGVRPVSVWTEWGDGIIGGLGLTDDKGKWIQTPVYTEGSSVSAFGWEFGPYIGNSVIVQHRGKYGIIDKDGQIAVDPKYESIERTDNPDYFKTSLVKGKGVANIKGHIVLPNDYMEIQSICEDIIVAQRKDGMYGCFDINGKQIIPFEYDEIRSFVEGRARIRYKGRFGFIDKSGEILVAPFFDEVENFIGNCSLVTVKGKKGFVTLNGDWIVSPMYDDGDSFSFDLAPLSQNDRFGYINRAGDFVIPMQYSTAKAFNAKSGIAAVALDGAWGAIDNKGRTVVPYEYDKVLVCDDGYVIVEKDGKSGVYDKSGIMLFPAICDRIYKSSSNLFRYGVVSARVDGTRVSLDCNGHIIYKYSALSVSENSF